MKKVIERKCSKCDSTMIIHINPNLIDCGVCSEVSSLEDSKTINKVYYKCTEEQHKQLTALAHNLTATNPAVKKQMLNILKLEKL